MWFSGPVNGFPMAFGFAGSLMSYRRTVLSARLTARMVPSGLKMLEYT
jgi:hypothetical protein